MAWRFWVTGGFAAVMAALAQGAAANIGESEQRLRSSRHSVDETVVRLTGRARERGLPLFVQLPGAAAARDGAREPASTLIVLGSAADETPVAQALPDGTIELPLVLRVVQRDDGGADVRYVDARWLELRPGVPPDMRTVLRTLERIVDEAVG